MTYETFKKELKEERDEKSIQRFVWRLLLAIMGVSIPFSILISNIVVPILGVLFFFFNMLLFNFALQYVVERKDTFDKIYKLSSFWWLYLIISVVLVVVLDVFVV